MYTCVPVTPKVRIHTLEVIYEMLCESKIRYGIEVSVLNKAWEIIEKGTW